MHLSQNPWFFRYPTSGLQLWHPDQWTHCYFERCNGRLEKYDASPSPDDCNLTPE